MYSIIRFGLIYGLALGIGFYVSHLVLGTNADNFTKGEIVGYSVMIISSLAVVMGIKEYKQKRAPAPLGFMGALGVGLGISLIAANMFALYNWLYLEFINPTFTATYIQYSEQQILSSGLEPIVIEQQLEELAHYADLMSNNFTQSMLMFATVFIIGLLFSLVSALALRTPRK
ncbi:DUF4199 domain-containing protein [Paraglaciecola arctica]|uniref:DUF4199 domain-containing protein n=1 Tax=Paraglaciecola arctica BSs20135 TaxID=493475 RepID=K6Y0J7_9ALTE|nr:DUF4199 domain-containing protein [Paraglaciecola arctica]GAC17426.1 hypothetical protein GARC_0444 [Paraglaciecola arctica BSs20135]|tara:strand:- start:294 stop:812 length:519 start_codon:yes stop_codon:yes gene_type:complete